MPLVTVSRGVTAALVVGGAVVVVVGTVLVVVGAVVVLVGAVLVVVGAVLVVVSVAVCAHSEPASTRPPATQTNFACMGMTRFLLKPPVSADDLPVEPAT
jgi:hypothetical protein